MHWYRFNDRCFIWSPVPMPHCASNVWNFTQKLHFLYRKIPFSVPQMWREEFFHRQQTVEYGRYGRWVQQLLRDVISETSNHTDHLCINMTRTWERTREATTTKHGMKLEGREERGRKETEEENGRKLEKRKQDGKTQEMKWVREQFWRTDPSVSDGDECPFI